jgi:Asp-tRNA(Asn)/Glu-tRNA(Gln) amidotransferase B subunit
VVQDAGNSAAVSNYRSGNVRALGALVAKVLALSHGRANPSVVAEELTDVLDNTKSKGATYS